MKDKIAFLQNNFKAAIGSLQGNEQPKWGKMSAQHTIEHLASFFALSFGKLKMEIVSPEDKLPLLRAFITSETPFKENTKAPMLPETPLPYRHANIAAAKDELVASVDAFFQYFKENPNATATHPVFGHLDYSLWVHLHYKHVRHHLTQFNLL